MPHLKSRSWKLWHRTYLFFFQMKILSFGSRVHLFTIWFLVGNKWPSYWLSYCRTMRINVRVGHSCRRRREWKKKNWHKNYPWFKEAELRANPRISLWLCSSFIELHPDLTVRPRQEKLPERNIWCLYVCSSQWHLESRGSCHALWMNGFPMVTGRQRAFQPKAESRVGEG